MVGPRSLPDAHARIADAHSNVGIVGIAVAFNAMRRLTTGVDDAHVDELLDSQRCVAEAYLVAVGRRPWISAGFVDCGSSSVLAQDQVFT